MASFTELSPFIEQEPSLEKWGSLFRESDDEVLEWLAGVLTNATAYYGRKEELQKMQRCLDRLEELYEKTKKDACRSCWGSLQFCFGLWQERRT